MPPRDALWNGPADPARRELITRALNISGAGSVLLQTQINKVVQLLTLRELGVQAALTRKPGSGNAAYINRRTAGTTGGAWVADTDTSTEETGTYAQTSFTYRTLLTKGQVTRALIAKGRSYGDVLATELGGKVEDFSNQFEFGLVQGDSGQNANQINGLITLIRGTASQVVANTSATGGDAVLLSKVDEAIDKVKGAGARSDLIIVGSFAGIRKLNAALQAQQRFIEGTVIDAGFRVRTYDAIPMITSTQVPDTMTWSGTDITALTGGSTTALAVINKRYMWIEELTPATVMPLARTTSQNESFELFWDGVLTYANTLGGSLLGGILA